MKQGKVKWFNGQKGFGFVTCEDGQDYFVHYSDIVTDGFKTLNEGATVQFEIEEGEKGARAVQVSEI
ncbi:MAG: cold shock domain-containing protein [Candidatus Cloacimonetes bacterium]|jgi:cold shock protein|nr:cold shock domain-containing protein [Candidatus Cloacimonadota bacterium]MBT6994467.1 cold shock domain-containing protein [Candidatus Cloacimonadota bacterium]MBT7470250.1 cold shock domain-containing protein [Candidatus Cloacimonadota bacterium]